jgi:hypothetical protein
MADKLREGYAALLHAQVASLERPGFTFVQTDRRDSPEWANWVQPIWPDSLDNKTSYALAQSVGLVKVAEMLFCAYAQPGWPGFVAVKE